MNPLKIMISGLLLIFVMYIFPILEIHIALLILNPLYPIFRTIPLSLLVVAAVFPVYFIFFEDDKD